MSLVLQSAVAAGSVPGRIRSTNQDSWSYSLEAGVFVVCDGMGGTAGGEVASQTAVEAFLESLVGVEAEDRTVKMITQAVCAANRRVHARGVQDRALRGMGTTLVALASISDQAVAVVHVGDSRCYRLRGGELCRCTEDHSLVAEQLRMGILNEEQAERSPMRHVITRAVGTRRSVLPEVQALGAEPGDLFLLCSDGLTRELGDVAIEQILRRQESLASRKESLLRAANEAGGRDNITVLLLEIV